MTVTTLDNRQPATPSTALAIRPGQTDWDKYQAAALAQIGLKDASEADRAVFLHQCQRTGLDPFSRQIYMIGRNEKQPDGTWGKKWTIQTGIDGWRVIRDRAARRDKVRVETSRAIWYDDAGNEYKVWVQPVPATACEITVTVDGIPYTSVLLYREYLQVNREGKPAAQWAAKPNHMTEKCTEADALRKAFPQDFAGVTLDDAMPPPEDVPPPAGGRVTAADIRGHTRPQVRGEVLRDPIDTSPADVQAPPVPAAPSTLPAEPAGEALPPLPGEDEPDPTSRQAAAPANPATSGSAQPATPTSTDEPGIPPVNTGALTAIWTLFTTVFSFTKDEKDQARSVCSHITGRELASTKDMSKAEARFVLDRLADWRRYADEQGIEPRAYLIGLMAAEAGAGDA